MNKKKKYEAHSEKVVKDCQELVTRPRESLWLWRTVMKYWNYEKEIHDPREQVGVVMQDPKEEAGQKCGKTFKEDERKSLDVVRR